MVAMRPSQFSSSCSALSDTSGKELVSTVCILIDVNGNAVSFFIMLAYRQLQLHNCDYRLLSSLVLVNCLDNSRSTVIPFISFRAPRLIIRWLPLNALSQGIECLCCGRMAHRLLAHLGVQLVNRQKACVAAVPCRCQSKNALNLIRHLISLPIRKIVSFSIFCQVFLCGFLISYFQC